MSGRGETAEVGTLRGVFHDSQVPAVRPGASMEASTGPGRDPSIHYLSKIMILSDSFSFDAQGEKPKEDELRSYKFASTGLRPLLRTVSIQEAPKLNTVWLTYFPICSVLQLLICKMELVSHPIHLIG